MAGREFGPPPSIITEFETTWRQWLNLVFSKIYKRTFSISVQIHDSIDNALVPMARSVLGVAPVMLADDTTAEFQNLGFELPLNWVTGTDLTVYVHFINAATQTGVKTVKTDLLYTSNGSGELIDTGFVSISDTFSLPSAVTANTLHKSGSMTIVAANIALGDSVFIKIGRGATTDTCVGDVGYQNIVIEYQGFINHE